MRGREERWKGTGAASQDQANLSSAKGTLLQRLKVPGRGIPRLDKLTKELIDAVDRNQLTLVFQPKISLRQRIVVSVEALVRWNHPSRGLIPPGEFIPAAEGGSAIIPLSDWVFRNAIVDQLTLAQQGFDLPIFVNVAASLLTDTNFMMRSCAAIGDSGAKIGIEITETSVIRDPEKAISNLHMVSELNIPIAIDDYGAGLSSLAYLKQLPAKELKIDKLFITQLISTHRDPLIVRSTIDLAHAMEMEVVAEGIEDETALALLTVMGCDLAQGYHISPPLALERLIEFLNQHVAGWTSENANLGPAVTTLLSRAR